MTQNWSFLTGFALGAACMYIFDPAGGRRRRALVRDQLTHLAHETAHQVDATARHWSNEAAGTIAEARRVFRQDEPSQEAMGTPQW